MLNMLKKVLLVVVAAIFMLLIFTPLKMLVSGQKKVYGQVEIGNFTFKVEIVDTMAKKQLGLGGHESLGENEGMLFPFNPPSAQTFWMKGVTFPIDLIWIKNNQVVGFSENLEPQGNVLDSNLAIYRSPGVVNNVLEVKAGTVKKLSIQKGDSLIISY